MIEHVTDIEKVLKELKTEMTSMRKTISEQGTETDSVYLPLNCQDAPELSTEESDTTDGTATADENGEAVVTSLEERVLRLEARVSALEAGMAAMTSETDGSAAMVIDDEL